MKEILLSGVVAAAFISSQAFAGTLPDVLIAGSITNTIRFNSCYAS